MSANFRSLNLDLRDSVFDPEIHGPNPKDPRVPPNAPLKVHVRTRGPKPLYKVWLFLYGDDLPHVESVTYTLHPTFSNPVRAVRRTLANPNCQLIIWTWGLFEINATIQDKMGTRYEISHNLKYDELLSLPGIEYVREDDKSTR